LDGERTVEVLGLGRVGDGFHRDDLRSAVPRAGVRARHTAVVEMTRGTPDPDKHRCGSRDNGPTQQPSSPKATQAQKVSEHTGVARTATPARTKPPRNPKLVSPQKSGSSLTSADADTALAPQPCPNPSGPIRDALFRSL
jgi:hypothetical protein